MAPGFGFGRRARRLGAGATHLARVPRQLGAAPASANCSRSHRSGRQVPPRGAAFLEIRRAGLFTPAGGFTEKIFGLTIGAHGSSTNGTTKKKACQKKIERRKLADHAAPRVACEQIDVSAGGETITAGD